jgi:hypothetical protein
MAAFSRPSPMVAFSSTTAGCERAFSSQLNNVVSAIEQTARDLRHQYTLGYVSSNTPRPGVFRTIRVAAHSAGNGKFFGRARSGYVARETL